MIATFIIAGYEHRSARVVPRRPSPAPGTLAERARECARRRRPRRIALAARAGRCARRRARRRCSLLRPRDGLIAARAGRCAAAYFDARRDRARAALRRARSSRSARARAQPRRGGGCCGGARAARRRRGRAAGARGRGRRRRGGAGLSLALGVAPLPFGAIARRRALAVGLATQSWRGWARDVAQAARSGCGLTAGAAPVAVALMRRYPRGWWLPAPAVAVAGAVALTFVGPVLLEPIFNDFTPLPDGRAARARCSRSRRAPGVRVGEVYEVDASRRTSAANAYVNGLGATRRVVLFDTLLRELHAERGALGGRARAGARALPRRAARCSPSSRWAPRRGCARSRGWRGASTAPATPRPRPRRCPRSRCAGVVCAAVGSVARQLSRAVERRADAFSLALTDDPEAFIAFERRITRQNLADPDPPRWLSALLGHPPADRRADRDRRAPTRPGERPTPLPLVRAPRRRLGAVELGQALDALASLPAGVVVLERVDQLAHEARREADARDDDAGDLAGLDLVVDAREGDRELVVGVADVREVRVDARHHLGRDVDVDVAVGAESAARSSSV